MMDTQRTFLVIAIAAVCTILTRALPFILFGKKRQVPPWVSYIGGILPSAVMATLLVYCLRQISFASPSLWMHEIIAVAVTAVVHVWRRNTLLSIGVGTVVFMVLKQGILG